MIQKSRLDWLVEWCFTPLLTVFQSYHGDSSHYSCLSWVLPVLGRGAEVSCPRTLPRKNPEDPVRLEPRTPWLQVKHFTTEPRRTLKSRLELSKLKAHNKDNRSLCCFSFRLNIISERTLVSNFSSISLWTLFSHWRGHGFYKETEIKI